MSELGRFERIVRAAHNHTDAPEPLTDGHPFSDRNIHDDLPTVVRELFDNGHYSQSTFEALKFLDEEVQRISGSSEFGRSLMMNVFNEKSPKLALNALANASEVSEQEGFKFIFAGAMAAIRNPRGHRAAVVDDPDTCLDHLGLTSMLLRRLDDSGLR